MNTVADAHKLRGSPESILRSLLERRRAGIPTRTVERDLLSVESDGARPRYGFLFGTGLVVTFLDAYYRSGHPSPLMAAALLVRAIGSALVGGHFSATLTARELLRVTADGDEWPDEPFLTVIAGAVPEIGFGFTPFARCDEQPGFFHAVGLTGSTLAGSGAPAADLARPPLEAHARRRRRHARSRRGGAAAIHGGRRPLRSAALGARADGSAGQAHRAVKPGYRPCPSGYAIWSSRRGRNAVLSRGHHG